MMMTVANPIYDVVFKYLMEDERIARTILSALTKKDIIHVEVRPHEYTNDKRDTISVFRIDFGATVREADGTERLILIELQKTWLPTETLRFRQYLGVQYENPKNMVDDDHALPTVAIYLLGHKVGDVQEPVVYVRRQVLDYNEQPVTQGLPNAFIDSLTHESIIVQIPRLRGQVNTRLDRVLSIFDQSLASSDNNQMLRLDDGLYEQSDSDMQRILHRLLMAAADADVRMDMNVEDEYFSIIERRDTEIMMRDRDLAQVNARLAEKNVQLEQQNAQLEQKEAQLEQQNAQLEQKEAQLEQQNAQLTNSIRLLRSMGLAEDEIAQKLGVPAAQVRQMLPHD